MTIKQTTPTKKVKHARIPHLDGLRAVALVGVLFFHFKFPGFSGGFIGVDMFFTISGFLITRNILTDLENKSFSLYQFYKRRFFRLYPASLVVILATLLTSYIFIRPMFQKIVSESAIAALTFWSNIFFHMKGEYFAAQFEMRPLLHFWSLSVEEQFYTFWPLLLMVVTSFSKRPAVLKSVLWVLASTSFIFAVNMYTSHATFAFYELPSRIFQFAAGALLCIQLQQNGTFDKWNDRAASNSSSEEMESDRRLMPTTSYPKEQPSEINDYNDILSVLCSFVVIISFMFLPPSPSAILLLPITFATCVLIAIPNAVVCEVFFSSTHFSWLGKLSYSIYLVHWPICILGEYIFDASGFSCPKVLLLLLSIWLGSKLHSGVENPMRYGASAVKRIVLFVFIALTIAFAVAGVRTNGFRYRFPNEGMTGWPVGVRQRFFWDVCTDVKSHFTPVSEHMQVCRVGDVENGKASDLFFFGDSFTGHLGVGLDAIGKRRGEYYDLRYVNFCGFRAEDHFKSNSRSTQGFPCLPSVNDLWAHMAYIPNGSTIAVANWWGEPNELPMTLNRLKERIHESGKKLAVVAEPPGISVEHKGYYSCADMAVLPIGRFVSSLMGRPYKGASRCLDFEKGVAPGQTFTEEQRIFSSIFENDLNTSKLINLFPHMCKRELHDRNGKPSFRCRPPASLTGVIHDIGYEPDLTHLTSVGSYNISDILEYELYG